MWLGFLSGFAVLTTVGIVAMIAAAALTVSAIVLYGVAAALNSELVRKRAEMSDLIERFNAAAEAVLETCDRSCFEESALTAPLCM